MLEHNELTQDEKQYPALTQQLHESYSISAADRQSLQRIHARLQQAQEVAIQPTHKLEVVHAGQFMQPLPQKRPRPMRWRFAVLAALLLLTLLTGALVAQLPQRLLNGDTPQKQATPTPVPPLKEQKESLYNIDMKSTTTGWGEANSMNVSDPNILIRTVDGGRTWNNVKLPDELTGFSNTFFLDEKTAWILPKSGNSSSGTPLFRTLDAGKTWEKFIVPGPGSAAGVTFVDKDNGWTTTSTISQGQGEYTTLRTTDGGKTWEPLNTVSAERSNEIPTAVTSPLNPLTGWTITRTGDTAHVTLYKTQDGGKSWQVQALPESDEIIPAATVDTGRRLSVAIMPPRFFDTRHGSLFVRAMDSEKARIFSYSTVDGGQTWQLAGKLELTNSLQNGSPVIIVTTAIDPTHFLLTEGVDLHTYELVEGKWQEKVRQSFEGPIQCQRRACANFIDGQHGWLTTHQQSVVYKNTHGLKHTISLYMTSDGGKSWQKIQQGSYTVFESEQGVP